ncbi:MULTISPECIES: DegV family protein [Coprobacillaceae]|uniref:DegV family protein n=1 Tax=Coprobacillaceae TaxID=2810280 RepID=UPI000E4E5D43|nr:MULTISPECIES: DegV family protein [Coprobacillaceae]RHM59078.1 DegV family protein [Coprobacillus sp. AF33-1AC]RHS94462.1 DegV family protein [Erysipelatoclostridium sp. AM42-17]
MKKVAIVTDSNSGITQAEGKQLGVFVLPMPFTIDGETYYEDINLTQEQFYDKLMNNAEVFTSQPVVGDVSKLWNKILKDYDEIVHIPMSSGLSGSCQTALMLASEYDGKVEVVNSQRISVTQKYDVLDAKRLADEGKSAKEIKTILENNKLQASIYITVNTLEYLKKGGRITPAAALLGGMLKIKPVLQIQGEKLDAFSKTRTMIKGKKIMSDAIDKDIKERFGDDYHHVHICVAYTYDREAALEFKEELQQTYPDAHIICDPLSLSVSCHIGPHALAVAICKVI